MKTFDVKALGLEIHAISGTEEVIVKCPFHDDRHPSASFNVNSGLFFCFACGAAANASQLAARTGGYVVRNDSIPHTKLKSVESEWRHYLESPLALNNDYLKNRFVTKAQVEAFNILELPWGVGFPIVNGSSTKHKALLIRRYEGNPRYIFFGEKPAALMGRQWRRDGLIVTEGIFGMLAVDRCGYNGVTTLGTAIHSDLRRLLRWTDVKVAFDADFPGYLGAAKILSIAPLAKVVIPGCEVDELSGTDIAAIAEGEVLTTNDISTLKRLSKDPEKFTRLLKAYRKRNGV